jgi:hypothetical protein
MAENHFPDGVLHFLPQLRTSTLDCIDSMTWVNTFGKLPLLERVCVQYYSLFSFFEALVYKTKEDEKMITATVLFPRLRYIHLEGTTYSHTIEPRSASVESLLYQA